MITTCNKDNELGRSCLNCLYRYLSPDDEHCVRCVHSNVDKNEKGETHWVQQKDETNVANRLTTLDEDFENGRMCSNCTHLSRSGNAEPCSSCVHMEPDRYRTGESHWYPMDPYERDDFKGEEGYLMKITNLDKDFELGRTCDTCAYLLRSEDEEPCSSCVHSKPYVLGFGYKIGESHWYPMDPDKRDDVKGEEISNAKEETDDKKAFVAKIGGRDYICTPGFSCLECVALDEFGVTWGIHSLGPYSED